MKTSLASLSQQICEVSQGHTEVTNFREWESIHQFLSEHLLFILFPQGGSRHKEMTG